MWIIEVGKNDGRGIVTAPRTAVRRLALGRVISMTGTFAAGTALTFTIYQQTRSTAWISAVRLSWRVRVRIAAKSAFATQTVPA